jgi:hypothetical protein
MAEPNTSTAGTGQESGSGIVDRMKGSATAQLKTQKDRGVDAISSVTQAVRSTTQRLRDEQHDTLAGYVEKAVDEVDRWSRQLKDKNVDELIGDVQRLARRQPAVFIGSAFALGVIGARFLKSSSRSDDRDDQYRFRNQYGARSSMSTAHDRSMEAFDDAEADVTIASTEVVISDMPEPSRSPGSGRTGASNTTANRSRKTGSRTEKS